MKTTKELLIKYLYILKEEHHIGSKLYNKVNQFISTHNPTQFTEEDRDEIEALRIALDNQLSSSSDYTNICDKLFGLFDKWQEIPNDASYTKTNFNNWEKALYALLAASQFLTTIQGPLLKITKEEIDQPQPQPPKAPSRARSSFGAAANPNPTTIEMGNYGDNAIINSAYSPTETAIMMRLLYYLPHGFKYLMKHRNTKIRIGVCLGVVALGVGGFTLGWYLDAVAPSNAEAKENAQLQQNNNQKPTINVSVFRDPNYQPSEKEWLNFKQHTHEILAQLNHYSDVNINFNLQNQTLPYTKDSSKQLDNMLATCDFPHRFCAYLSNKIWDKSKTLGLAFVDTLGTRYASLISTNTPAVFAHEFLHVLGADHVGKFTDIMYFSNFKWIWDGSKMHTKTKTKGDERLAKYIENKHPILQLNTPKTDQIGIFQDTITGEVYAYIPQNATSVLVLKGENNQKLILDPTKMEQKGGFVATGFKGNIRIVAQNIRSTLTQLSFDQLPIINNKKPEISRKNV